MRNVAHISTLKETNVVKKKNKESLLVKNICIHPKQRELTNRAIKKKMERCN